jgi:nucleotide-binding universal stress UspA family protein
MTAPADVARFAPMEEGAADAAVRDHEPGSGAGGMIIVGIDFSTGSATAASVALRLAQQSGAQWRILHVTTSAGLDDIDRDTCEQWLEGLGLTEADVERRRGVPWIELVRAVGEVDATLLVAGTHGRTGFQPLRLGQTAELVSLRSPAPVVLVPPMHTFVASAVRPTKSISQEGSRT